MADITIKNIKNIPLLEFDIPNGGVHILTGSNGSGKTTLMTSLSRLGNPYAFQKNFKTSSNNQFDSFRNGEITYLKNGNSVTYRYRQSRWAPTPKKGSATLAIFGFPHVVFIGSDVDRFYVQDQELKTRNIQASLPYFRDSMNLIFATTKFNGLRKLKIFGKGKSDHRRNIAFLLPETGTGRANYYFSEKNFSLGEVLILNALYDLYYARNNALILVDEVELALHPKVQIRFYDFIKQQATQKNFTVLISTHSSSLIKASGRCIYLEKDEHSNSVVTRYNCFPATVLKDIAFAEDFHPDFLFCVEDDHAEMLWLAMIRFYFRNQQPQRTRPEWKVIPIGGWPNVIKFRQNASSALIPSNVRIYATLDQDSEPLILQLVAKGNKTPAEIDLFQSIQNSNGRITYLPVTPEQGLMEFYTHLPPGSDTTLQTLFDTANLNFSTILLRENQAQGGQRAINPRDAAKTWLSFVVDEINRVTNWDRRRTQRQLYDHFVVQTYQNQIGQLNQIMGPIFY